MAWGRDRTSDLSIRARPLAGEANLGPTAPGEGTAGGVAHVPRPLARDVVCGWGPQAWQAAGLRWAACETPVAHMPDGPAPLSQLGNRKLHDLRAAFPPDRPRLHCWWAGLTHEGKGQVAAASSEGEERGRDKMASIPINVNCGPHLAHMPDIQKPTKTGM